MTAGNTAYANSFGVGRGRQASGGSTLPMTIAWTCCREQKRYEPGEKAVFQVRMPFRKATALVTVEREGVMDAFVTELSGKSPVVEVPVRGNYAPNVFVSVLAVRGRVGDVQPTALVDLGKPAFKMGVARDQRRLARARAEREGQHRRPGVPRARQGQGDGRGHARDRRQAAAEGFRGRAGGGGRRAARAGAERQLEAARSTMMQRRGIEVDTATASMQVVGKRHYGRKAREAGRRRRAAERRASCSTRCCSGRRA